MRSSFVHSLSSKQAAAHGEPHSTAAPVLPAFGYSLSGNTTERVAKHSNHSCSCRAMIAMPCCLSTAEEVARLGRAQQCALEP